MPHPDKENGTSIEISTTIIVEITIIVNIRRNRKSDIPTAGGALISQSLVLTAITSAGLSLFDSKMIRDFAGVADAMLRYSPSMKASQGKGYSI